MFEAGKVVAGTVAGDLVGMSALLNTTMPSMQKAIDMLVEAGVRDSVQVIVGGCR